MGRRALRLLERELASQVLPDGGHEERSASYHLLMLDRLLQLAEQLQAFQGVRPSWLLQAIGAMAAWAASIRLADGSFPRFNDSAADAAPPLDALLASAQALLGKPIA
ncbi:MAG: heparinase II/III family protein, partial [bacterium]